MITPESLSRVQTNDCPPRKRPGKSNPRPDLTIRVYGCLPLSRCGSATVAFSPTIRKQPMTDEIAIHARRIVSKSTVSITGYGPLCTPRARPLGGVPLHHPTPCCKRVKGCKGVKACRQASERRNSIYPGVIDPFAVEATRVNGGAVK